VIKQTKILLPPLSLQNRFAAFVQQADKSKFELQQTLDSLESTYKAILKENLG
jgi:type I restriction enzyme S subunit